MDEKHLKLSKSVGDVLKREDLTISIAESCTGGALMSALTDVTGSSSYVIGGLVTYSNRIKTGQLGVNKSDIEKYGAVSKPVALQMAQNVAELMQTNIGISTTGIAGPGGGSDEKPVGTVWIGFWSYKKHFAIKANFSGTRLEIKRQTIETALELVREIVLNSE